MKNKKLEKEKPAYCLGAVSGTAFTEMTKEKEAKLISVLAHFYKELPLAFEKGITSTAELSTDERTNAIIEMYEELKKQNRLTYCH